MGMPFVSGRKAQTKPVMAVIHAAKKRKIPNLSEQSRDKKDWAMAKVNSRFTATVMLCPADLVSSGNISLGTVHPSGPQDHPNAATNRHTTATTAMENPLESSPVSGSFSPSITATDLEGRHEDGQHQLRPVPPLKDVPEGVLNRDGQLTGLHHVLELGFDMAGPSDLLQNPSSLFGETLFEETIGGLREEEPADGHQRRRHGGEAQGEPPPPRIDPLGAVVDHVGREDPRGRRQLEHHVEPSPEVGRRHLGEIEGHRLRRRRRGRRRN
ncbi:unnamed protein product [Spirodela intermedia]|uniref:Uncharacterized protein n=1 Tax=Spirodela intermedia TaxID=51605 RepID=A0A7I8KKQ0_SPIIN|nr:unnamed protein product [Spirodela intermedia]